MYWNKDGRRRRGGYWRCREKRKTSDAANWRSYYHERMPATVRIPRQLDSRRRLALTRRRERQLRRET